MDDDGQKVVLFYAFEIATDEVVNIIVVHPDRIFGQRREKPPAKTAEPFSSNHTDENLFDHGVRKRHERRRGQSKGLKAQG